MHESVFVFVIHENNVVGQINPVRTKELTNIRAPGKDENIRLSPPRLVCPLLIYQDITRHLCFFVYRI